MDRNSGNLTPRLTNGATGPTAAAQAQILVAAACNSGSSVLPTNFSGAFGGRTGKEGIDYPYAKLPIGIATAQLVAGSYTGQIITADAGISAVTGV